MWADTDGPSPSLSSQTRGHRHWYRVRVHVKSRCFGADVGRNRWYQTVSFFPDASRGPEGWIRRSKRGGTTVPSCEGHRHWHRVWVHVKSRCLVANVGRYRWSQSVSFFPDASRGPRGRIRHIKRGGTTVPTCEGHLNACESIE
jgi:hypothetical protein